MALSIALDFDKIRDNWVDSLIKLTGLGYLGVRWIELGSSWGN